MQKGENRHEGSDLLTANTDMREGVRWNLLVHTYICNCNALPSVSRSITILLSRSFLSSFSSLFRPCLADSVVVNHSGRNGLVSQRLLRLHCPTPSRQLGSHTFNSPSIRLSARNNQPRKMYLQCIPMDCTLLTAESLSEKKTNRKK